MGWISQKFLSLNKEAQNVFRTVFIDMIMRDRGGVQENRRWLRLEREIYRSLTLLVLDWLSVLVFQDHSGTGQMDFLQRMDSLQTGAGEYDFSCRGEVESGGVSLGEAE